MGAYIKENWLFVVVAVYLVSMVLYGHYRGFVRLAVSAVSLVLSLGVVHFGAPSVAHPYSAVLLKKWIFRNS